MTHCHISQCLSVLSGATRTVVQMKKCQYSDEHARNYTRPYPWLVQLLPSASPVEKSATNTNVGTIRVRAVVWRCIAELVDVVSRAPT